MLVALESGFAVAAAFAASALVSGVFARYRGRWALMDLPNHRSLHADATPRSGGIGILAGLFAGAVLAGMSALPGAGWSLSAFFLVAAVSFGDDVYGLPPYARFLVHAIAAALLVFPAGYKLSVIALPGVDLHAPVWLLDGISLLFVIWMVNLYNFMDGLDGLAGGMACFGFGTLALLGALAGAPGYAVAALMVAAATAGFLPTNFPPARLFMGDLGSGSLGFLGALFLLWGDSAGLFPLWLGGMVFSPFIVDATWTVIRRCAEGKKPWQAHREHFYQRLVGLGWSHRRTVLWAYALMLKCSLLAVACFCFTGTGVRGILLGWLAAVYLALIAVIKTMERRRTSR
ncbi:MAG TPA: glycosyltransferase family 4 protein [Gammaproteobacteria bacterium]|nr:glycosyltransferase family 4 protein [Gammaproteobacteria bacterium]